MYNVNHFAIKRTYEYMLLKKYIYANGLVKAGRECF